MAGPWEKYKNAPSKPKGKPWEKYADNSEPLGDGSTVAPYEPSLFERAMTGLRQGGIVPRANIRDFEAIGAGARAAVDTALFGFGDEAQALVKTAGPAAYGLPPGLFGHEPESFSENLAEEQARSKSARVQNPTASTIGDVAGLATGVAGIGKAGLSMAAKATTPGKVIGGSVLDGGLYGGLAGFGHTDGDLADRGEGFVEGAAIGAAVGGTASGLTAALPAARGYLARRVGQPESQAKARIAQALTPDAAAKLDELGPDGMVIDALGERGRALGRSAANSSPEAREMLETASRARMAGQSDRLTDSLLTASRMDAPQSVDDLVSGIRKQTRPGINAAYDEARSLGHDIDMSAFDDLFQTDMGRKALEQGQRLARDRMAAEGIAGEPSSLAILDEAKKALDDMARPALGQGPNNQQSIAGMLSKQVRQRIDDLMPEYGGARELAASAHTRMNAVNIGAEGAKPRVPVDYARRAEKAAFAHPDEVAQGYASGKIDQLQNRRDTPGVVDTLFGPRRQQDAMQAALGPDGAAAVQKQIAKERTFGETHRALTGNSTTARQLIEQSLIGGAGGGLGLATTGDVTGAGGGVAAALLARHGGAAALRGATAGREAKVAPVIAKILTDAGLPASVRNAATKAPDKVKEAIVRALMLNGVGPQLKPE
ncbi:hypothetical protein J7394_00065 [Ruegeria sp. R13_0]|uniref:hypothetical protein n=1 Tax=Ruegeria sp. R13_0 TaxID=2821099 RepID=UPI001ADC62EB|nr:hypothetical protein [Ruegeria sp. R13_0]MBO9432578.1 hypothetical protein [Ruegeria sp. R13_0]